MSAAQVLDGHLHCDIVSIGLNFLIVQRSGNVDAAGRADDELAPVLGVEVQQDIALQFALGQVVGTIHARLLVGSDEGINGTVLQILGLHNGHDGGNAQTVVGAEGRALGLYPFAVNPRLDGVGLEIMC